MTSTHYLTHAAKRLHEAASFANGMTGSNAGTWETLAREIDAHVAHDNALEAAAIQAIEESGHRVSGPTDSRACEDGEPKWVCALRAALASA